MKKQEAAFTPKFLSWARAHINAPAVFELKSTRGKEVFYLRELKDHQRMALLAATQKGFTYKISDSAIGYKPFDAVLFGHMRAYVVIKYPKHFYVIAIQDVPDQGTLTEVHAKDLATMCG